MFNQFNEEDLILTFNSSKDRPKESNELTNEELVITRVTDLYRDKMLAYMKSVPHITPTQFELNIRHQKIKLYLIKQLKLINKTIENCAVNRLVDKCESNLETLFNMLATENTNEYKKCQLGFTLGWKCNVNQPTRSSYDKLDDRF